MRREEGGMFLKESHRRSVREKQQRAQVYSSQVRGTGIYCDNDTHKEPPRLRPSTQGHWSVYETDCQKNQASCSPENTS